MLLRIRNKVDRYGVISVLFHWLMALFIIGQLVTGFYMQWVEKIDVLYLYGYHKSVGLWVLIFVVFRYGWRMINVVPHLSWLPNWQQLLARLTHGLLYVLMVVMPISGWLMSSYANKSVNWLGFSVILPVTPNQVMAHRYHSIHEFAAWSLVVLLMIHIVAVIKHSWVDGDHVFGRMMGQ